MRFFFFILLFAGSLAAADGSGRYEKGKTLYFQNGCNNCHGARAEGSSAYPLLANRPKGFLAYKLRTFRSGIADNPKQEIMIGFSAPLSDDDIDAVATFLNEFHDAQTDRYDPAYQQWGDGGS